MQFSLTTKRSALLICSLSVLAVSSATSAAASSFPSAEELLDPAPATNDNCGRSAAMGDFDGNGLDDIVIGCDGDDTAASGAGNAIVFTRNKDNNGFNTGVELFDPDPAGIDECGASVTVGDFNGDRKDDVVIGCGNYYTGNAIVFTRNGPNTGFEAGVELSDPNPTEYDDCGKAVATGDFNGDLLDDVVIGCDGDDTAAEQAGNAVVFTRNSTNTGFETGVELSDPNPAEGDDCGESVAAGDLNGDALDDIVMNCTYDDTAAEDAGNAVVFTRNGANTGFDTGVELFDPNPAADDHCGDSQAAAVGDLNGDGLADVVIGCDNDDTAGSIAGNAIVFTRDSANTGFDTGVELFDPNPEPSDYCGYSTATGDISGDGLADVVVGCKYDGTGDGNAIVFTRDSANTGFDTGVELADPSPAANNYCGSSVASGDLNADGLADVLMGCTGDDTAASHAGNAIAFLDYVPTVSITDPRSASRLSGKVTVRASASDDGGITGVEFLLDGTTSLGTDTSSPYSVLWSTYTAVNGRHRLSAVATDSAGHTTSSSEVRVNVRN